MHLDIPNQKERFLERNAPYLPVLHFIENRVTLEGKNPKP